MGDIMLTYINSLMSLWLLFIIILLYLDTVADLHENTNEEVDEPIDDILLPIQDLPKVRIKPTRQGWGHQWKRSNNYCIISLSTGLYYFA